MNNISKRGFASISQERRREIASQGGKAAHRCGKAHQWTQEQAREAGRKGGVATRNKRASRKQQEQSQSCVPSSSPLGSSS